MILIRNRDELKRDIDNLITLALGAERTAAGQSKDHWHGRINGLRAARELIVAWEESELHEALGPLS